MSYSLAIEIGGVNTSIYKKNQGLVLKEPSLVCASSFGEDQYEIKAIGTNAEKLQGKTNELTYIFSPIVCGEVKSVEYTAEMLKYFLDKIELRKFPKENVVFVVPAGISEDCKDEIRKVAKISGLGKVAFLPAVVASAHATGLPVQHSKTIIVVHVGGTLTDISAINMNSILKGASIDLGGRYLDVEIAQYISKKHKIEISIASAKRVKEKIATLIEGDWRTTEIVGIDENTGKPKQIIVSSEEILPILTQFMENIIVGIETTINICPPEISNDIATDGIFLSGGLCEIGGLEKYLSKKLQIKVNVLPDAGDASILMAGKLLENKKLLADIIQNF